VERPRLGRREGMPGLLGDGVEVGRLLADGLFEPRRRLPGRSRKCDLEAGFEQEEQGEQARHGRGLAGSRTSGDDGETAGRGERGGQALTVNRPVGDREDRIQAPAQSVGGDGAAPVRELAEPTGKSVLVAPVAVEVDPASLEDEGTVTGAVVNQRTRGQVLEPGVGVGPAQIDVCNGAVLRAERADRVEIQADMAEPGSTRRERGGEQLRLVARIAEPPERARDPDVDRVQNPSRAVVVERRRHRTPPCARRASRSSTRERGGRSA
jgi:hypothetical protein